MATVYKDTVTGRFIDNSSPKLGRISTAASSDSIERLVKIVKESKAIIERHKNDPNPDNRS